MMSDADETELPEAIERVLRRFAALDREDKMGALIGFARKLEPLPERFAGHDEQAKVPECQTPLSLFVDREGDALHYYAAIDSRQSPTVAAFLAIVFSAVNNQPASVTLGIPSDFVRRVMQGIGLGTREVGLEAIIARLKRLARETH